MTNVQLFVMTISVFHNITSYDNISHQDSFEKIKEKKHLPPHLLSKKCRNIYVQNYDKTM